MEDFMTHFVKSLEIVFDADTALRLAEEASRNAQAQTKLSFESTEYFETEGGLVKLCDNCHQEKCRGMLKNV